MTGAAGIIGVGNMGAGMALRLLDRGFSVVVHDIRDEARAHCAKHGAVLSNGPSELARACDVLIIAVVDTAQVLDVIDGLSAAMKVAGPRPRTVFLCPTISPQDVCMLSDRLLAFGLDVIDAPMSGGPARARDGSMSLMLAGPQQVLQRHQAVLDALSSRQFFISERLGDAATTKLVNNLLAGINLVGAAQAMLLAQKMGLDWGRTLDVIESSSGQSWIGSDRMRRAGAGDFAPRAHVGLLRKDTRLALDMAQDLGLPLDLGEAAARVFAHTEREGWAESDDAAVFAWLAAQENANRA